MAGEAGTEDGGAKAPEGGGGDPLPGSQAYIEAQQRAEAAARRPRSKPSKTPESKGGGEGDEGSTAQPGTKEAQEEEARKAREKAERDKGVSIPKARLDQVLADNRKLKETIARLEGKIDGIGTREEKPERKFDFAKATADKWAAIKEGDHDKAMQLEALIDSERERERQAQMEDQRLDIQAGATRSAQTQVAVQAVLAKFPKLEKDHEEHNPEALDFVLRQARYAMMAAQEDDTINVVEELNEIAVTADARFGLSEGSGTGGGTAEDQLMNALGGGAGGGDGKKSAAEVAAEQAKEKAAVAKRQPANPSKLGEGGDEAKKALTPDEIRKMPDSDWDKMDRDEVARLRGDYLEEAA